jgi:hypothetical protein
MRFADQMWTGRWLMVAPVMFEQVAAQVRTASR